MNKSLINVVLLLICILSRFMTSINYLEDYQSLLVSMNVKNEDFLSSFQTFQSPLFISAVKIITFITNNFFLAFSIAGGISLFLIIHYTLKILKTPLASLEGGLVSFLIFFNPLLWIASNRFTPELGATAITFVSLFFLINTHENKYAHHLGWFFAGLLGGVHFPYLPFLLCPLLYSALYKKNILLSLFAFMAGISFWLLPVYFSGGKENFMEYLAQFVSIKPSASFYAYRFLQIIRDLWTGGLGGYWLGRSILTVLISLAVLPSLFFGTLILLGFDYSRNKIIFLLISFILLVFAALNMAELNNVALSPVIPFLMIILSYGLIYFLVNFNALIVKGFILLFLFANIGIGIYYSLDHRKPSSAEQLRQYLFEKKRDYLVVTKSPDLKNYLLLQGISSLLINEKDNHPKEYSSYCLVTQKDTTIAEVKRTVHFQHSYVRNATWPTLVLYEY